MNKMDYILEITVPDQTIELIKNQASEKNIPVNKYIRILLNDWSLKHENEFENITADSTLNKLLIRADDETKLLFMKFMAHTINSLIDPE